MARYTTSRGPKGRTVGRSSVRNPELLTEIQEIWLGMLVAYCLQRQVALFIGTVSTTGSLKITFYNNDDKCSGSLPLLEDWSILVPEMIADIFQEPLREADLLRDVPWAGRKASEAPRDRKPMLRPSETVETPQKPS